MNWDKGKALALMTLVWMAIYLPGLGSVEIQGEEGRRILPAVEMLKGGSWVVPSVGGELYYNKPPGINWLVAASFAVTGRHDEFAARLPSALLILAMAGVLIAMDSPFLSIKARLAGAQIFLTNFAMIEKGRLIEIEAVYVALTGLATIIWLNYFVRGSSPWRQWIIPCLLLAAGALVKGPFLAIPFYAVVICVSIYQRQVRRLFSIQHIVGAALIVAICIGWLLLARQQSDAAEMGKTQASQIATRFSLSSLSFREWALEALLGLAYFMPWMLFVPALWMRSLVAGIPQERLPLFKACRLGMVIGFAGLCVMPHLLSRYTLPAYPIACIMLGWVLAEHKVQVPSDRIWKHVLLGMALILPLAAGVGMAKVGAGKGTIALLALTLVFAGLVWRFRARFDDGFGLTLLTALTATVVCLGYAGVVIPIRQGYDVLRPAAAKVNGLVPPGERLYVFRPGYRLSLVYLREPQYLLEPGQVGPQVRYLVLAPHPRALKYRDSAAEVGALLEARHPKVLHEWTEGAGRSDKMQLLDCGPASAAEGQK